MEILKLPHPSLFTVCAPVTVFGEELKILLEGMWDAMNKRAGIGLAANQVGLSFRMFTMIGPKEEKLFIVNPVIKEQSKVPAGIKEGCLSAPGEFVELSERGRWVMVEFQDETGLPHCRVFQDIHSVCVQHEIGHLDGKSHLQSKSIPKAKRKELAKKWGLK